MITYKKQSNRMSAAFAGVGVVIGLLLAKTMGKGDSVDITANFEPLIEKYAVFRNTAQLLIIPVFILMIVLIYVIVKRNLDNLKHS